MYILPNQKNCPCASLTSVLGLSVELDQAHGTVMPLEQLKVNCHMEIHHYETGWAWNSVEYEKAPYHIH